MKQWRVCLPWWVPDSHHFDEEQDLDPDLHQCDKSDPYPDEHQSEKRDPYPHHYEEDP